MALQTVHFYQLVGVVLGWLMELYFVCLCGVVVPTAWVVRDPIRDGRLPLQRREEVLEEDGVVVVLLRVQVPRDVDLYWVNLAKGRAG